MEVEIWKKKVLSAQTLMGLQSCRNKNVNIAKSYCLHTNADQLNKFNELELFNQVSLILY